MSVDCTMNGTLGKTWEKKPRIISQDRQQLMYPCSLLGFSGLPFSVCPCQAWETQYGCNPEQEEVGLLFPKKIGFQQLNFEEPLQNTPRKLFKSIIDKYLLGHNSIHKIFTASKLNHGNLLSCIMCLDTSCTWVPTISYN